MLVDLVQKLQHMDRCSRSPRRVEGALASQLSGERLRPEEASLSGERASNCANEVLKEEGIMFRFPLKAKKGSAYPSHREMCALWATGCCRLLCCTV